MKLSDVEAGKTIMPVKKIFKWLFLLFAVLVIGVSVLLFSPGLQKQLLERFVGKLTGRELVIDGNFDLDLGTKIRLDAKNIRLSNPDWAIKPWMIEADQLVLVIDTSSLFGETVSVESIDLNGLYINLETSNDGLNSWDFKKGSPSPPKGVESPGNSDKPAIIFGDIQVINAQVQHRGGVDDVTKTIRIANLQQHLQPDGLLHIELQGDLNGAQMEYTGTIGPYVNLLQGKNVSIDGKGQFGSLTLSGKATIDDIASPHRPLLNVELKGPNIDDVTSMLGVDDLGSGGFLVKITSSDANGELVASLRGDIGDFSINISAQLADLSALEKFDLQINANGPSLGSFTRAFGIRNWPDKPFNLQGSLKRHGQMLDVPSLNLSIGGTELALDAKLTKFPDLDSSRVHLSIKGDDVVQFRDLLGIKGIATGPFELKGSLDVSPEGVELVQLEAKTSAGKLLISGTLTGAPAYVGSKFHVSLNGGSAHAFLGIWGIDALPDDAYNLDTRVEVVNNGIVLEHGVLVTIGEDRVELGGLISFARSSIGTDFKVKISGDDLADMLSGLLSENMAPADPYDLSGRVRILEQGTRLDDVKGVFNDINLTLNGLIARASANETTRLDFAINGDNFEDLEGLVIRGVEKQIVAPGLKFDLKGEVELPENGYQLNKIVGHVGDASISVDGLIGKAAGLSGTDIQFSIAGSDLRKLLVIREDFEVPAGAFKTSGRFRLSEDTLRISGFEFDANATHGKANLSMGWPVGERADAEFDITIMGPDIRLFVPAMDAFKPNKTAFDLAAIGNWRGDALTLKKANLTTGDLYIDFRGSVDTSQTLKGGSISFALRSPDLSGIGELNGQPLPAVSVDATADFSGSVRHFFFDNLKGSVADHPFSGRIEIDLSDKVPRLDIKADIAYLDIRPYLEDAETEVEAAVTDKKNRLIPDTPLPLEMLASTDLKLKVHLGELRYIQDSLNNLEFDVEIEAGKLSVTEFSLDAPHGRFVSSLFITPTGNGAADVSIDLNSDKVALNLAGLHVDQRDELFKMDVYFKANGHGRNWQEVAGSLNGTLSAGSEGGLLRGVSLGILDSFLFDKVLAVVTPQSKKEESVNVQCAALSLHIESGLATTIPYIAFETDRVVLLSSGTLNLKNEELKLDFNATPVQALNFSVGEVFHSSIAVTGTLMNIKIAADPGKVLLYGGVAVGTLGLSILAKGLIDRVVTADKPCRKMLDEMISNKQ